MFNAQELTKFSSLARPLDPFSYRTNLAIVLLTVIGGVIAGAAALFTTGDLGNGVVAGFFTGAHIFTAWVLARELDPDYDYSAFFGAILGFVFATIHVDLVSIATLIVMSRVLNRIVGLPAKPIDNVVSIVLVVASLFLGQWQMGIYGVLLFALDAVLDNPLRSQWVFALIALVATLVRLVWQPVPAPIALSTPYAVALLVISLVFVVVIVMTTRISVTADIPTYRIHPRRVQALMTLTLLVCGAVALWSGDSGVQSLMPAWTTMAGISIYRFTVARFVS